MKKRIFGICMLFCFWVTAANSSEFSASVRVGTDDDGSSDTSATTDDGYLSEERDVRRAEAMPFWLGIGIRAGGGGNILLKPTGARPLSSVDMAPFEDGGGGLAGGGGAFLEMRWIRGHMGLELGAWNERNRTWATVDARDPLGNTVTGNKVIYYYSVAHLPILLKFYLLKGQHRVSFGLGPEFTIGLKSTHIELQSDLAISNLRVKTENDILAAVVIGWGIKYGDWVVGLDLKSTYNVTQPREYNERVTARAEGFQVIGSHTIDFRLMFSLMYEMGFGR
jgi:hypothetical protein